MTDAPADLEQGAVEIAINAMGWTDPRMASDARKLAAGYAFSGYGAEGDCLLTYAQVSHFRSCLAGVRAAFRDAAGGAEGFVELFGYWVEQKHADPVLLRKPAYIPEASDLRVVTPLYATPQPGSGSGEREAIARQLYEWMPCVLEASIEAEGPGSFAYATWEQLGENVRQSFREKAAQIALIPAADAVGSEALRKQMSRFYRAATVEEREACAKVAECAFDERSRSRVGHPSQMDWEDGYREGTQAAAQAIRARAPTGGDDGE